jgi:hypothetical protein
MAPQLRGKEKDLCRQLYSSGKEVAFILGRVNATRSRKGLADIGVDVVRRSLQGKTRLQGRQETRGRKRVLLRLAVRETEHHVQGAHQAGAS